MQKIKYTLITAIFFSIGLFASEDFDKSRVWDVQIVGGDFIFYRVPGQSVWGHRYGFVKQSPNCTQDQFFLEWSSYEDIKLYEGQYIPISIINEQGIESKLKPTLIAVKDFTSIMQVGFFAEDDRGYSYSSAFKDFNKNSKQVTLSIGDDFENFDIKTDTFLTSGYEKARMNAERTCRGLASNDQILTAELMR